jgi:hypothetical protein
VPERHTVLKTPVRNSRIPPAPPAPDFPPIKELSSLLKID